MGLPTGTANKRVVVLLGWRVDRAAAGGEAQRMDDLEIDPVPDRAVRAPRRRSVAGLMVVAALALAIIGAVALTVSMSKPAPKPAPSSLPQRSSEPDPTPSPDDSDRPTDRLRSSDPSPGSGLWCAFLDGGVPLCAEGLSACERQRGRLAVAASPCERTAPSCFVTRDRTGDIRVCAPTIDGCEQTRVGPIGRVGEVLTGCLPAVGEVVPDDRNILVGTKPPEQWCTGRDCTGSEHGCAMLREQVRNRAPCERRRLWCSGHAPDLFGDGSDCAGSDRACETQRQRRVNAGKMDFGPCWRLP